MNEAFRLHVEALHPAYERLIAAKPFKFADLGKQVLPLKGIYLFSEGDKHLYVGRTNKLKQRLGQHCGDNTPHNQASFAFLLALEICGTGKATYKAVSSRKVQVAAEPLKSTFAAQKARLQQMAIRTVEEADPNRQALLEMYVSIALGTPYNDFDTH
jgi:predicted GIY-YIG superfamily endonuclease